MNSSARLDELAQRFNEDPRRYFAPLANEYRKSGQARRAVELCREQLAVHPGHLSGHVVLALALHDLGEAGEARQAYQEALQLDPENVLVLRSLGDLARESGEPDVARDWYERAMGVDPRDPEVARRLAALEREQEGEPLSAADLSFTAALAAAELRHRDEPAAPQPSEEEVVAEEAVAEEWGAPQQRVEEPAVEERVEPAETDVPAEPVQLADNLGSREAGQPDEAAEFTAGFFATVLDEPAVVEPLSSDSRAPESPADALPSETPAPELLPSELLPPDAVSTEMPSSDALPPDARQSDERPYDDVVLGELVLDEPAAGESPEPDEPIAAGEDAYVEHVEGARDEVVEVAQDEFVVEEAPDESVEVAPHAFVEPDMDQLFAELETGSDEFPGGVELAEPSQPSSHAEQDEPLGTELALADGGAVGPDLPSLSALDDLVELDELPVLETYRDAAALDAAALEEAPAEYAAAASTTEPPVAFVTETMAQLYLQQGLAEQALLVYRQLAGQRPEEPHFRARVAELEAALAAEQAARSADVASADVASADVASADVASADVASADDEPAAASWLQRLARARPTVLNVPAVAGPEAHEAHDALEHAQVAVRSEALHEPEAVNEPVAIDEPVTIEEPEAVDEPIGAEELVIAPAEEPVAHDVSAFEWSIPEPEPSIAPAAESDTESTAGGDAPVTAAEMEESPDDDPWIFEGERMAAAGISGDWDAVDEVVPAPVAEPVVSEPVDDGRSPAGGPASVTLDELLARPVPNADEQAAGALAAATLSMQDDPEVNAQLGEAAAEDPSSLLHLLRGTPRSVASLRQGASFSFDQFFRVDEPEARAGSGAGGAAADVEPATPTTGHDAAPAGDSGAESDLADFHAWLSGLSKS